jgi:hypothetical protein
MLEITTTARLVDYESLAGPATASIGRRELEAAVAAGRSLELVLDVVGEAERRRLAVELSTEDAERILEETGAGEDEVVLAFGTRELADLFDAEVEAHGLRGALALAVAAGAIAAPSAVAASPQASTQAAKAQVSKAAAKAQVSTAASKAQVAKAAAVAQVAPGAYRIEAAGIRLLRARGA